MSEAPTQAPVDAGESNYVAVTPCDREGGKEGRKEGGEGPPRADSTRARTRVRARDAMAATEGAVTHGVRLLGASWHQRKREQTPEEAAAPQIERRSLWRDGPAPAVDVVAYTRSGAWLRGQRNDLLEMAGQAWGYAVALPVTLLLGALIWCFHRFHRAAVLAVVIAVLWVSA